VDFFRESPWKREYVRTLTRRSEGISELDCVIISRRHKGDPRPKYCLCTDLSLSAQEALRLYQRRWLVEVDNFYLAGPT